MTRLASIHLLAALSGVATLAPILLRPPEARVRAAASPVTYNRQIAPIFYDHCTSCHHPGGPGPFSLLTYADAERWGTVIQNVIQSRFMPPWLPAPGYCDFADNRRLS